MAPIMLFLCLSLLLIFCALYRLKTILSPSRPKPSRQNASGPHILIVLGSGGHTAEMLAMLSRATDDKAEPSHRLNWRRFNHRTWVCGTDDALSARRAAEFEAKFDEGEARIETVPRARQIHQSLLSTPLTCLRSLVACTNLLLNSEGGGIPDLILSNGPATATILVLASLILRFFDVRGCHSRGKLRTLYVESWARVRRLSLSGRVLEGVVDRFVVQWPQLAGGRREFLGLLV